MAREAILEKLAKAVVQPIVSEQQVSYILVSIRRYLERLRPRKRYAALNFFCCWAVHSEARGGGADRILKRLDDAHAHLAKGDAEIPQAVIDSIGNTLSLQKLHDDLEAFCLETGLPTTITETTPNWLAFVQHYSAITEDCPFVLSPTANIILQHVRSVLVERLPGGAPTVPREEGIRVMFRTRWHLIGDHGKGLGSVTIEFTENENASNLVEARPLHLPWARTRLSD